MMSSLRSNFLSDFFTFRLKPRQRDLNRILIFLLVSLPPFFYAYFWESRWLQVIHVSFDGVKPLRIAHLSDIHFKGDVKYLRKIVQTLNDQDIRKMSDSERFDMNI